MSWLRPTFHEVIRDPIFAVPLTSAAVGKEQRYLRVINPEEVAERVKILYMGHKPPDDKVVVQRALGCSGAVKVETLRDLEIAYEAAVGYNKLWTRSSDKDGRE